ncbi:hypothetical protein KQX54_021792 [Cotesia glomerata]|uniref:Uncharacterized protein n=1 Tax=Cotesia glomerata TaxID=32391 RepID=A0AAV7J945_COTGL|nr:hypothetical protein KQX54_021792 [Cotesia glomerata]
MPSILEFESTEAGERGYPRPRNEAIYAGLRSVVYALCVYCPCADSGWKGCVTTVSKHSGLTHPVGPARAIESNEILLSRVINIDYNRLYLVCVTTPITVHGAYVWLKPRGSFAAAAHDHRLY